MEENELDKLLDEVLALADAGKTYVEIRRQLQDRADESTIAYVIRLADELIMEENRLRSEYKKSMFKVYLSLALTAVALLIFLKLFYREGIHPIKQLLSVLPLAITAYFLVVNYLEALKWKRTQPEVDDSKLKLRRVKRR